MKCRHYFSAACCCCCCCCLLLSGCGSTINFGFTGKTSTGEDYVLGISVPVPARAAKPTEPALPTRPGEGKNPLLPAP